MTTALHEDRLRAIIAAVVQSGARTLLDLGCGDGDLILRLAPLDQITRITGLDIHRPSLTALQAEMRTLPDAARAKISLAQASMTKAHPNLRGYDCACLVETIEHLPLGDLPRLENALFGDMRPQTALITTPNADYNPVLGVPAHRFRHPGHHFEWGRETFGKWARGVAARRGYAVSLSDIGGAHPHLGGASQMAEFRRDR
ncbi:Methyltransferase domain protein [Roseovarius gaetbuli]|uniref:Small RNA 2'-O-methyltransferase n=1 Tax=Roseovarius gaetbuli TaxID=1356575 RepID=A0A1X6ZIA2_9RHOB|nr:methyltransferase [Roseovarius gaetbuli]SLN51858.1 Methyltransferase domain protein [Roseovarius gaetbuli]